MEDIIIKELTQGSNVKIAIFTYTGNKNPKTYLDEAIREYTEGKSFNQFIDSHLDNPWTRVVVLGINEMKTKQYA
jgi:hypothetical protein